MKRLQHRWLPWCALLACLAGCGRDTAPPPAPPAEPAATAPGTPGPPTQAQREAGAVLAANGARGIAACTICHGARGQGDAAAGYPRIAGQSHGYLLHQLESYAGGSRRHESMQPIARAMTPRQRAAAAAYYAALPPDAGAALPPEASAPAAGRGSQLALRGDRAAGVPACLSCHGPAGIGGADTPYLAGQHASYLVGALAAWGDGTRATDRSGRMPAIARALTPEDIAAVAGYYAAIAPRSTPVDGTVPQARSHTAVLSGPRAPASGR